MAEEEARRNASPAADDQDMTDAARNALTDAVRDPGGPSAPIVPPNEPHAEHENVQDIIAAAMQGMQRSMGDVLARTVADAMQATMTLLLSRLIRVPNTVPHMQGELEEPGHATPENRPQEEQTPEQQLLDLEHQRARTHTERARLERDHEIQRTELQLRQQRELNENVNTTAELDDQINVGEQPRQPSAADATHATTQSLKAFKPPAVKPYDDKSLAEQRDAVCFLDDLKSWLDLSGYALDAQAIKAKLVSLIAINTQGQVRKGWRSVEMKWRQDLGIGTDAPLIKSWDECCTAFCEIVGQPAMTRQDALDKLLVEGVYQNTQSVVQYYTTFNSTLLWCAGSLQPETVVTLFVKGLREPFKSHCRIDPVTQEPYLTLSAVYKRAQQLEKNKRTPTESTAASQEMKKRTAGSTPNAKPTKQAKTSGGPSTPFPCRYCKEPMAQGIRAHNAVCSSTDNPNRPGGGGGGGKGGGGGEKPGSSGKRHFGSGSKGSKTK